MTKRILAAVLLLCLFVSTASAQSAATVFGWPPADGSVTNAKLAEPVSIANGGTGATTAAAGLAALGGASLNGSSTVDFAARKLSLVSRPAYSAGVDFRAYRAAGLSLADDTYVTATYTAELYDISSSLNPVTGDITITESGLYLIDTLFRVNNPTNAGHIYMQLTDSPVTTSLRDATVPFRAGVLGLPNIHTLIQLSAGTYSIRFKQVSGGAETVDLASIIVTQLRRFE